MFPFRKLTQTDEKAWIAAKNNKATLIVQFIGRVFPLVKKNLAYWREEAAQCPDRNLAAEALASIDSKGFHCLGGSVFALYPGVDVAAQVKFIVAYQTISDYLDNLVDNLEVQEEQSIVQLHLAMLEALQPDVQHSKYYAYYPYHEDGGYLDKLVAVCQDSIKRNPNLSLIQDELLETAMMYSNLQTYKHLALNIREEKMFAWLRTILPSTLDLTTWELAAATGSTLGIFCMHAAGSSGQFNVQMKQNLRKAYFPWICGLHILLDYLIDLEEDSQTQQLNFVQYYETPEAIRSGMEKMWNNALYHIQALPNRGFHQTVIQGLLALYLSDVKTRSPNICRITSRLLSEGGNTVRLLHWLCLKLRKHRIIE